MRENTDQENSEYGHILRSVINCHHLKGIERYCSDSSATMRLENLPDLDVS